MRFPRADDPELMAAIRRYVNAGPAGRLGRYLKLLHGNALNISGEDRTEFELALGRDARQITDRDLSTLLDSEWRSRLMPANRTPGPRATGPWGSAQELGRRMTCPLGDRQVTLRGSPVFAQGAPALARRPCAARPGGTRLRTGLRA